MPEQTFRLRRLHVVAFAGIAGMALAGCNTTTIDDGSAEAPAGVCSHTYREPVFNISYAVNALTGESLGTIVIQSISINDRLVTDDNNPLISSQNIERVDGHWRCSLPCGLGNEEGRYRVVVDAPGYLPQSLTVQANYRVYEGGCPSYSDQGLHVGLALEAKASN
jgi:hypothetical protein